MATKKKFSPAQIAAQKKFVQLVRSGAFKKKAAKKARKKNPAKPALTKPSKATGKRPSKRLVSRRKANTKKGYFPNPEKIRYTVSQSKTGEHWNVLAAFYNRAGAFEYAKAWQRKYPKMFVRVTK